MAHPLDNYLRTHRRRAGLSEDEVAFLLGGQSGTTVSRYERSRRRPSLSTLLAFERIFDAPARELFNGLFHKVEARTKERARLLTAKLSAQAPDPRMHRKLEALRRISEEDCRRVS